MSNDGSLNLTEGREYLVNYKEESQQKWYYSLYKDDEILKLVQFTEMIILHSLILLMNSKNAKDQHDFKLHEDEFKALIRAEFSEERHQEEVHKEFHREQEERAGRGVKLYQTRDKARELNENNKAKGSGIDDDQKDDEETDGDKNPNIYVDPVTKKAMVKSQLPPFFCLDIFFKYRLYDEACQYLFYRRDFNDLFQMIRWEYQENQRMCDELQNQFIELHKQQNAQSGHGQEEQIDSGIHQGSSQMANL